MYAWQFAQALYLADRHGWARFVSMQNHYNLLYREEEREMLPFCRAEGIGVIPWSPLARGMLTRPAVRNPAADGPTERSRTDEFMHRLYTRDDDFATIDRVGELAEKRGLPRAQIALAWLLHQPGVTAPIVGASQPHHLEDALAAVSVQLSADERQFLEAPYQPHPVSGHT